jgi:hypothetical protein
MTASRVPRLHVASPPREDQVPLDVLVAPVRDRLASERQRLDAVNPQALDAAAEALALLHEELRGELASLAPSVGRTARYLRGEMLGEHGFPIEDLFALGGLRPDAVATALARLMPEPETKRPQSLGQVGAEMAADGAAFAGDLMRDLEAGRLTLAEVAQLELDLSALEGHAREMRSALVRRRP